MTKLSWHPTTINSEQLSRWAFPNPCTTIDYDQLLVQQTYSILAIPQHHHSPQLHQVHINSRFEEELFQISNSNSNQPLASSPNPKNCWPKLGWILHNQLKHVQPAGILQSHDPSPETTCTTSIKHNPSYILYIYPSKLPAHHTLTLIISSTTPHMEDTFQIQKSGMLSFTQKPTHMQYLLQHYTS
jgi:hypothetical protein